MSRLTMMITLEKAIQKSMTRPRLSVHHTSFLWTLCQELVRSTIHLPVAANGEDLSFYTNLVKKSRARGSCSGT
jgi:hypothetical protein